MKYSFIGAALATVSVFIVFEATSAGAPDRPPSVPEKYWIPLSEKLGFVVIPSDPRTMPNLPAYKQTPFTAPPATGFFMAKTQDGWRHLIVIDPPR